MTSLRRTSLLLTALIAAGILSACGETLHRDSRLAMSTTLSIVVSARRQPSWEPLFAAADRLDWEFDHRRADSPVGELNRRGRSQLRPEAIAVLQEALEIAALSAGAFDPTVLPLTAVWSFDTGGRLPEPVEIEQALERTDYTRLSIDATGEVTLPEGFGLDLGGIAKGAVVDLLSEVLDARVGANYLIDAGGDILVSGLKDGDKPWVIAIRNPRDPRDPRGLAGTLSLGIRGGKIAVVTSGDYERYFDRDGRRYHHILDPRTGYPARGPASVTVIAGSCARADALATAAYVLGPEGGLALLEALDEVEGLILSEENGRLTAVATSGFPLAIDELILN